MGHAWPPSCAAVYQVGLPLPETWGRKMHGHVGTASTKVEKKSAHGPKLLGVLQALRDLVGSTQGQKNAETNVSRLSKCISMDWGVACTLHDSACLRPGV